ncbi:MAG: GLPGLI family protein [Bacteroidia bacterium]|nr:GLPGLI family protein [Bacteroidia bacterium]
MKTKYLLLILYMAMTNTIFAQKIQVIDKSEWLCIYNYEFTQDSLSRYSLKSNQMVLQIGSQVSKFTCLTYFIMDSLYLSCGTDETAFMNMIRKSKNSVRTDLMAQYTVYKNHPQKGLMFFMAYDDQKFFKVEQPMRINWKLDNREDTVILGYTCQKAYTSYAGRNYTAWYSTQIPLNDGPYKFNGLPGLILKISDTKNEHCFTLNSIKKVKYTQPITFTLNDYIDITAEEYTKIMKNKMARLFGTLQSGSVTFSSEEAKAKSLHGLKARNNFIEKF